MSVGKVRGAFSPQQCFRSARRLYWTAPVEHSDTASVAVDTADAWVVGAHQSNTDSEGHREPVEWTLPQPWRDRVLETIRATSPAYLAFQGKLGHCADFYLPTDAQTAGSLSLPRRLVAVGLGPVEATSERTDTDSGERARIAAAVAARFLQRDPSVRRAALFPAVGYARPFLEGALLASYSFDRFKTAPKPRATGPVEWVLGPPLRQVAAHASDWKLGSVLAGTQNLARTWMNTPANWLTPALFVQEAQRHLSTWPHCQVVAHDPTWIRDMGMNTFWSVAQGSTEPARFLEIHYRPPCCQATGTGAAPSTCDVALVGKGVTFDSGGISLKPGAGMALMKGDMGGAAVVLATMVGVCQLGLPVKVSAYIPLTENMPSGSASKPGDVVRSMQGSTVEIDNTDAEGRLILADALTYALSHQPNFLIDVATLTGAMDVALGNAMTGFFSNSDRLSQNLMDAGQRSGELLWRMPLHKWYQDQIKSDVADLRNVGGRGAGACTAAAFLQHFATTPKMTDSNGQLTKASRNDQAIEWAHLDMAGVMHQSAGKHYHVKGMTGRPTRALLEFLIQRFGSGHDEVDSGLR